MSNLKAGSYTAEAYEQKCAELEALWNKHQALVAEYKCKDDELEKTKIELEIAGSEYNDLHDFLIEAKAIRQTLYVIFGRGFDND